MRQLSIFVFSLPKRVWIMNLLIWTAVGAQQQLSNPKQQGTMDSLTGLPQQLQQPQGHLAQPTQAPPKR